ncbi:condensation domain-containing protein [Streptomyces uncialis]|uniref:condensation domain-containing protein n=1 Tax=Streptomyces uncialis TaxID=1048205 RepID=UPI0033E87722
MTASKSANLCWGQRYHWLRYQQVPAGSRHEAHITDTFRLPAGTTLAQVRSVLGYLVRRHEVLRTVYDARAHPWPQQRVQPPAPMTVHEVTGERDGTPSPAEFTGELTAAPFDMAAEWPMRACVVTTGGVPDRLHLVFNHVAFDDVALGALRQEFEAVLTGVLAGRPAVLPPVGDQPADLAAREAAITAPAVEEALGHWRDEAARLPADVYARRRRAPSVPGAAHSASFTSPALLATVAGLAERHRVWPAAVHLAAYAVTTAAHTGEDLVSHRMYTSQREDGGRAALMTCQSSPALVAVDLSDDPPFSEVLRRAAARVEQALTHARVPYDGIVELLARESTRRGQRVRVASELNFLDHKPRSCGVRRDRFTPNPEPAHWARSGSDTYFRVYEWQDGITLVLQAMDAVMDAEAVERFLRGYAALLEAHRDPGADLRAGEAVRRMGFAPAPERPLIRIGPDVVDLAETRRVLLGHPAVASVTVTADARGLTAEVLASADVTPAALRVHVLGALHDHPAARCPGLFRVTVTGSEAPAVEGDGRTGPAVSPATDAEHALTAVVAEVNGLGGVDLSESYTGAGGRALRTPRVVAELRVRGWEGVSPGDLTGVRPLLTLAGALVRSP